MSVLWGGLISEKKKNQSFLSYCFYLQNTSIIFSLAVAFLFYFPMRDISSLCLLAFQKSRNKHVQTSYENEFSLYLALSNINIKHVKQEQFSSWFYAKDRENEQVTMCDKFRYQMAPVTACVNTWTLW